MSQAGSNEFIVLVRSEIAEGFRLAGATTLQVDAAQAGEHIEGWLDEGRSGLLAVEANLLDALDAALVQRLDRSNQLYHVEIPGIESDAAGIRLGEMVEAAVGFSLGFGESS